MQVHIVIRSNLDEVEDRILAVFSIKRDANKYLTLAVEFGAPIKELRIITEPVRKGL